MKITDYIISDDISILNAMEAINIGGKTIVFICDGMKLKGVISDGDIRRYIIGGGDLENSIKEIANYHPIFVELPDVDESERIMLNKGISAIPVLDEAGNIVKIVFLNSFKETATGGELHVPVVIMAGGKGTRLLPYTQILPKPLLPIDDRTILECIMDRFEEYACTHFDIIINYKKNLIKSYFIDNQNEYDISFLEEREYLGTAGGLRMLLGKFQDSFFVSNCDILIEMDYKDFFDYHKANENIITMVCAKKKVVIPYGTVELMEDNKVIGIHEKPQFEFQTNTGMYLVEPEFVELIPDGKKIDITDVIDKCIQEGKRVGAYLIDEEDWLDMGQIEAMEQMKKHLNV